MNEKPMIGCETRLKHLLKQFLTNEGLQYTYLFSFCTQVFDPSVP